MAIHEAARGGAIGPAWGQRRDPLQLAGGAGTDNRPAARRARLLGRLGLQSVVWLCRFGRPVRSTVPPSLLAILAFRPNRRAGRALAGRTVGINWRRCRRRYRGDVRVVLLGILVPPRAISSVG